MSLTELNAFIFNYVLLEILKNNNNKELFLKREKERNKKVILIIQYNTVTRLIYFTKNIIAIFPLKKIYKNTYVNINKTAVESLKM